MPTCPRCRQDLLPDSARYLGIFGIKTVCPSCRARSLVAARLPGGKWGERGFVAALAVASFAVLWFIHPVLALVAVVLVIAAWKGWDDVRTYRRLRTAANGGSTTGSRRAAMLFAAVLIALAIYHLITAAYQLYLE